MHNCMQAQPAESLPSGPQKKLMSAVVVNGQTRMLRQQVLHLLAGNACSVSLHCCPVCLFRLAATAFRMGTAAATYM
jgi:hypothetical protein